MNAFTCNQHHVCKFKNENTLPWVHIRALNCSRPQEEVCPGLAVGTPYTRPNYNYCNRSCNSKSSDATIIAISLTDKVQPNIFVIVSHRISCCLIKALQQSLDSVPECSPSPFHQGTECTGRYLQHPLLGNTEHAARQYIRVKFRPSSSATFTFLHLSSVNGNCNYLVQVAALIRKDSKHGHSISQEFNTNAKNSHCVWH